MKILNSKEKRELLKKIDEQFEINENPLKEKVIIESGDGRIWTATRDIEKVNLKNEKIETIGLYIGKIEKTGGVRLSIEGSQIIGPFANKNVITIDRKQLEYWIRGINLNYASGKGYILLKYEKDHVGCGKLHEKGILNHTPKERRIRELI